MKYTKIGDICQVLNGYAFKSNEYVSSGIRVIRITNVQKGFIEDSSPQFFPIDRKTEIEKYCLYDGDLLISLTGNVGRVGILNKDMLPAALNQRVACLRLVSTNIEKAYLYHFLNSDYFEQSCIFSSKGIAQKNMSTEWLKDLMIPLYSITEQRNIATILGKIDEANHLLSQKMKNLDQLVKSRFIEMFGDFDLSKQKPDWIKISDLGSVVGGSTPKTSIEEYWNGKFRWISPAELEQDSGIIFDSIKKITKAGIESCSLQELPVGTVILSSRAPIGKVAIAGNTFYCNQGFKNIICGSDIKPRFLYTLLLYNTVYLNSLGRGATFKEISKSIVENIRIPKPEISQQEEFISFVEKIDKSKLTYEQEIAA